MTAGGIKRESSHAGSSATSYSTEMCSVDESCSVDAPLSSTMAASINRNTILAPAPASVL